MTRSPAPSLSALIDQGRGLVPADLVLKGGRVFDLITGELVETDVAICGDTIVGVFGSYRGKREIDVVDLQPGKYWIENAGQRLTAQDRPVKTVHAHSGAAELGPYRKA